MKGESCYPGVENGSLLNWACDVRSRRYYYYFHSTVGWIFHRNCITFVYFCSYWTHTWILFTKISGIMFSCNSCWLLGSLLRLGKLTVNVSCIRFAHRHLIGRLSYYFRNVFGQLFWFSQFNTDYIRRLQGRKTPVCRAFLGPAIQLDLEPDRVS